MTIQKIRITNPFEMHYNPITKELFLSHVESPSGHRASIQFDSQATRALWDCLALAAQIQGGILGADVIEIPKIQ
jgi:hypothetical protein